jgi:predicted nucleic acid-binding protein
MITVVLDTNVLVSGLLTPHSPAAMLLRLIAQGSIRLAFDQRILAEYREVVTSKTGLDFIIESFRIPRRQLHR